MLYVIPDTLLKVAFNTNKTGHHVLRYTWHVISGAKPMSVITHIMVAISIGVEHHLQQYVSYNV
jgi:hypothetical protein